MPAQPPMTRLDRPWHRPGAAWYAVRRLPGLSRPPVLVGEPPAGSLSVLRDLPVVRDGTTLRVNVVLPAGDGPFPVLLSAHPYGKDNLPRRRHLGYRVSFQYRVLRQPSTVRFSSLTGWEAPDPAWWRVQGYAVVNCDLRGGQREVGGVAAADQLAAGAGVGDGGQEGGRGVEKGGHGRARLGRRPATEGGQDRARPEQVLDRQAEGAVRVAFPGGHHPDRPAEVAGRRRPPPRRSAGSRPAPSPRRRPRPGSPRPRSGTPAPPGPPPRRPAARPARASATHDPASAEERPGRRGRPRPRRRW
jgi:X-Pro dipeptidyl-peptidase (S15 family)